MTRPSDESVACAFVLKAMCYQEMARLGATAQFDAESPAGTAPDMSKSCPEVTTSAEPVYFSAQPTHVRCPKCTASISVGKTCGGPNCGLRK